MKIYKFFLVVLFCSVFALPSEGQSENEVLEWTPVNLVESSLAIEENALEEKALKDQKIQELETLLRKHINVMRALDNDQKFSFHSSSQYGQWATELHSILNQIRSLARTKVFPDSTVITLVNIYASYFSIPLNFYIQERLAHTLKAVADRTAFPVSVGAKIENIILNQQMLPLGKSTLMQTVREQIKNHSRFLIEIDALTKILSDKSASVEIQFEALYTTQTYAEKKPLTSDMVFLLENIIQDKTKPHFFREVAVDALVEGIKDHRLPSAKWEAFINIIKENTAEQRVLRASLMLLFMDYVKHQSLPDVVLQSLQKSLQQIIYNKKEFLFVRRSAQQAFISIVENTDLKSSAILEILKDIVRSKESATHIREAAIRALKNKYSADNIKRKSTKARRLWRTFQMSCRLAF